MALSKIPSGEKIWVKYYENDKLCFVTTSNKTRDYYKLYSVTNDELIYTKHKSSNPIDLEKHIKHIT